MALHQSSSRDEPRRIVRAVDRIWTSVMLALLSVQAEAQANDPITRLLNKGVDLLTNQWAVASAIITIAALGYRMKYRMKYGMMDKRKALYSIIGIVVVFGAVLIVDEIRG
jgi:type IV secretory pathway VirB2 component (pilin)